MLTKPRRRPKIVAGLSGVVLVCTALALPLACSRRVEEPDPVAKPAATSAAVETASAAAAPPTAATEPGPSAPGSVSAAVSAAVSASASAAVSASASTSASASPSASASVSAAALASASAAIVASPIASRMLGLWGFSRFDLTDPATASKWNAIPPTMQQDILAEAPKASIELLPGVLITRLVGVPDRKATWTIESETADELVIKTSDEGRKKIRFPEPDAMRIQDLDKKDSFVTIFARKPAAAPAPAASASAGTKK